MMQIQFLPYHIQLHHLDPAHRAPRRSGPGLVAVAKDPVRAGGRRPVSLGALGLGGRWAGVQRRRRPLRRGSRDLSRGVAGRPLANREVFPAIQWTRRRGDESKPQPNQSFLEWVKTARKVSLHEWVFESNVDDVTRRRWLPLSSTLVLPGLNIYERLNIDDPERVKGRDYVFRARGRDLNGAIFDLASLPKVDFEGAQLRGASLRWAQLDRASFDQAQLQGASLDYAQLQGASLEGAQLQGASFFGAQLHGASLYRRNFRARTSLAGASGRVARWHAASGRVAR